MITEKAGRFTPDVFTRGGEVFFQSPRQASPLAALSFVREAKTDLRAARRECLATAMRAASEAARSPEASARLLLTYAWEPDSVRSRTFSPQKALALNGISFSAAAWTEVLLVAPAGVKWFADIAVTAQDSAQIEAVLFKSWRSALVLDSPAPMIYRFLDQDWGLEWIDAPSFVRDTALMAARWNHLVIRLFGAFDDREASADIIGNPDIVRAVAQSAGD